MPADHQRTLVQALIWPLRRLLDPRFADVNRRLASTTQAVHDEGAATRVAVGSLNADFKTIVGSYAESGAESLTHLGVELRRLQDDMQGIDVLRDEVRTLAYESHRERLDASARGGLESLDGAVADLLNRAMSHRGFAAEAELWLNPPVVVAHREHTVRWTGTNERIVEIPFTFAAVAQLPFAARILDVGAAESTISLSLASLGHHVTALDPRGYPFAHPNLTEAATVVETYESKDGSFDAVLLVSTLEHVGLGFYGEQGGPEGADRRALQRLGRMLDSRGVVVLTVPYGKAQVTDKERVYDDRALEELLDGWAIDRRVIVERQDARTWTPVDSSAGPAVAMLVARRP